MHSNQANASEAIPLKARSRKERASDLQTTTYEFPNTGPPVKKSFGEMIYDKQHGKVLGRTPKNWGEILIFYTIFYICLAALFAICLKGLFLSIDKNEPTWKLQESLIGTNPGLGFRPISHDVDQGSLIWYDATNSTQVNYWVERIDDFLGEYNKTARNQKVCDFDAFPVGKQVCVVDISKFGNCSRDQSYGYEKSSPCFFLKLNRIFGWMPQYYNDPDDLPEEMPTSLKDHIRSLEPTKRNQVWISCNGEDGSDQELLGPAEYYPNRGLPSYFFPFRNYPGYVSPIIAVQFLRPALNQIINIECRTWAKNIIYSGSKRDRMGSVHFEIMIDKDFST